VTVYVVDKSALVARAAELQKQTALLNARERAMQEVMTPLPPDTLGTRPAGAATSVAPAAPTSTQVPPPVPSGRATPLVAPAPPKAAPPPPAAPSSSNDVNYSELRQTLQNWRAAWIKRDVDTYLGFYAPNFVPSTGDGQEAWKEKRKAALNRAVDISLEIADLTVTLSDATNATMVFKQTYGAANYRDIVTKTLQWMKVGERWLIVRESSAAPLAAGQ
jgi:outer membrane protein, adhesin transport system